MTAEDKFVSISALLCEPTRAKMLWNLLDGRAYTAGELSVAADTTPTAASNHLSKLLEAELVKVDVQGRHRYYSLKGPEIAYAVEGLANLAKGNQEKMLTKKHETTGISYCRSCYDHLAGFVGVKIAEALELKGCLTKSGNNYIVNEKGLEWMACLDIHNDLFHNGRRPLARQCLDWSERRPHLAGQLGAALLDRMLEKRWFVKIEFSRELFVTGEGRKGIYEVFGVVV